MLTAPTFLACWITFSGLADLPVARSPTGRLRLYYWERCPPIHLKVGLDGIGSFFINVRQVMEDEKKIHILQQMEYILLTEAVLIPLPAI